MELMGTCALFSFARALLPGREPSEASEYVTREPESTKPLHAPNTEIIMPTEISLPPKSPKIAIATAEAGAARFIISSAGNTHRYAMLITK